MIRPLTFLILMLTAALYRPASCVPHHGETNLVSGPNPLTTRGMTILKSRCFARVRDNAVNLLIYWFEREGWRCDQLHPFSLRVAQFCGVTSHSTGYDPKTQSCNMILPITAMKDIRCISGLLLCAEVATDVQRGELHGNQCVCCVCPFDISDVLRCRYCVANCLQYEEDPLYALNR